MMNNGAEPDLKKAKKKGLKKMWWIILLVVGGVCGLIMPMAYREIVRDVTIENPSGTTGTAFLVLRPGVTLLPDQIAGKITQGLVNQGWRVEVTTSSSQTSINITRYNLVVFVSPVYGSNPHPTMVSYLKRVDLADLPVVLLLTSIGKQPLAMELFRNATVAAHGRVVDEVLIGAFDTNAFDAAYQAGNNASLAGA